MTIREMVIFPMLGALMFCSKIIMEALPNIHLLGMFIMTFTLVFRWKALIPIYIYIFINGLYAGFPIWWYPYLYVWAILWALTMILPKKMPRGVKAVVYPLVCGIFGISFGLLYAPGQALMYGFSFEQAVAWTLAGLSFDLLHFAGNLCAGLLIVPLTELLGALMKKRVR